MSLAAQTFLAFTTAICKHTAHQTPLFTLPQSPPLPIYKASSPRELSASLPFRPIYESVLLGPICGCIWHALHEGTPKPLYPLRGWLLHDALWLTPGARHPCHCSSPPSAPARVRGSEVSEAVWQLKTPSWVHSSSPLPLLLLLKNTSIWNHTFLC